MRFHPSNTKGQEPIFLPDHLEHFYFVGKKNDFQTLNEVTEKKGQYTLPVSMKNKNQPPDSNRKLNLSKTMHLSSLAFRPFQLTFNFAGFYTETQLHITTLQTRLKIKHINHAPYGATLVSYKDRKSWHLIDGILLVLLIDCTRVVSRAVTGGFQTAFICHTQQQHSAGGNHELLDTGDSYEGGKSVLFNVPAALASNKSSLPYL